MHVINNLKMNDIFEDQSNKQAAKITLNISTV